MEIKGKSILILGGWGLVGTAICRKLISHAPKRIIIGSLTQAQAEEACAELRPLAPGIEFTPTWGNIFVRSEFKDTPRGELLSDPNKRMTLIQDVLEPIRDNEYDKFYLHELITGCRSEVIIDCVNSATILAYQDVYSTGLRLLGELRESRAGKLSEGLHKEIETLLASLYVPQLVRHMQVLQHAMEAAGVFSYIKVGTCGTGGMGLNIPYTHSEDRPSRMLLSKSCMAGAQSLLLFLMGRTPSAPYIKEIKPAASIAWKRIGRGEVCKGGVPIPLYDCAFDKAVALEGHFDTREPKGLEKLNRNLQGVFIDTGENGIFSLGEFTAITAAEQMEFVTPEEIADCLIWEIEGGNSGRDIVGALDSAVLGPTYRAGVLRACAIKKMNKLVSEHQEDSVAYELLGPPRLSKLLHEANLLKRVAKSINGVTAASPEQLSAQLTALIKQNSDLRSRIVSIGIPILLPDGKSLLRGPTVHVPKDPWRHVFDLDEAQIDRWAEGGWVDLRASNMSKWQQRFAALKAEVGEIPANDTSSWSLRNGDFWDADAGLNEGEVVGWLFVTEDKGRRIKR